ncbi:MAG TPA: pentapeptide repeat-containing protein [Ktedonobacteraceae bacterium]
MTMMRKQIKAHPRITVSILFFIALALTILIGGYKLNWAWTGFTGTNESYKTLYDWMQLLFIPLVLTIAGLWFNHRERKAAELRAEDEQKAAELRADNEQKTAELRAQAGREIEQQRAKAEQGLVLDNQREAALQGYINEMSELLLHENLRKSKEKDEVRNIARVRTLTIVPRLDGSRKRSVLEFLYEAGLILRDQSIIDLYFADFSDTFMQTIDLHGADLSGATLHYSHIVGANLQNIDLSGADMSFAIMQSADLRGANLKDTDFTGADLLDAKVTQAQLNKADLAKTTMPDGSISGLTWSFDPKGQ